MHRKILAGACALAALTPTAAFAADQGSPPPGVPAGKIERAQTTQTISGTKAGNPGSTHAVQALSSDSWHVTVRGSDGKVTQDNSGNPKVEKTYNAAEDTLTLRDGHPTPPINSLGQEAAYFKQSIAQGCQKLTGTSTFRGRPVDVYTLVKADTGPCRGDADVGTALVERSTGYVLQRTSGEADGSFTQTDTVDSYSTQRLNSATRPLLRERPHPGAKIVDERK